MDKAKIRHPVSLELLIISFVQITAILSSLWLMTEPDANSNEGSEPFYKTARYSAIIFGFFIVFSMIACLASRQVGFGYIMLVLSGVFYGDLMRNSLSAEQKSALSLTDNRVFVMSNLVVIFSVVFSIILFGLYMLERTGLN